jgi:hypothetical protein
VLTPDEIVEIVGTQVTFLLEEGPQNLFAFGRAFSARGVRGREISEGTFPHEPSASPR